MTRETLSSLLYRKGVRQFITYAICGGSGVIADLALFSALFLAAIGYQIANLAGYLLGTLLSFVLNRHFTFQAYDNTLRRMGLFFGVAAIGYGMSTLLLWALVEKGTFHPIAAKGATLFCVLILQFAINRAVTFRPHIKTPTP